VILGVGLPGIALCAAAGIHRRDSALLVGQGLTLGLALHGLVFLAGRAFHVDALVHAWPFVAVAASAILLRRRPAADEKAEVPPAGHGLLLVALLGCLLQPLASTRLLGEPMPVDLLYHAGNAAELRHRWPLEHPRVAGVPLNYPVLAYAIPADASALTGLPVADALHGISTLFWIALLALQTGNAGRLLLGDGAGAALGAAVVLLHEDVGSLLGLGRGAFGGALASALYGSPTSVCGLVFLAGLVIAVADVLSGPAWRPARLALLAVLALAASLTKATIAPVAALGGLLAAAAIALRRGFPAARRALVCGLVVGLAAVPFTLRLGAGQGSYRGMLRWDPGALVLRSPFATWVARSVGSAPGDTGLAPTWLAPVVGPAWLLGHLGLAGVGTIVFLLRRRDEPLTDAQVFALAAAGAGASAALLLDAQDSSQLFFIYNADLLLGVLAGAGLSRAWRERRRAPVPLVVLGLFALPSLLQGARVLLDRPRVDFAAATRVPDGAVPDYAAGLAWLRAHAAQNAVVFADNPSLLLSAFGECRMYYESGLYSPREWERKWEGAGEPYPERVALQESLLRRPDAETVAAVRRLFPAPVELLAVADSVQSRVEAGFLKVEIGTVPGRRLLPPPYYQPVFANRAMHVYRVADEGTPR
jgi:hypothetical protein